MDGNGVCIPCGAIWSRGVTVFVPGLLEWYTQGSISDPGTGPCLFRVGRDLGVDLRGKSRSEPPITNNQWMGVEFMHRAGRYRPMISRYSFSGCWSHKCGRFPHRDGTLSFPDAADCQSHSLSAISRWGRGFYTARGGVDPEGRRFCPHLVGVVEI